MPSRHDAIAAFYTEKAAELDHAVSNAITGNEQLIEDVCSYAWTQLIASDHVTLDTSGFSWLYVVAVREAYRQTARGRREHAYGTVTDLPGRSIATEGLETLVLRRELTEARRALLRSLPERKREMLLLHAAGFSYAEIARICDATLRTVERQMLRGKRALRQSATRLAA